MVQINEVRFHLPEDLVAVQGVATVVCIDSEGRRHLRLATFGEPPYWTQAELHQAGADRARERLKEAWN